MSKAHDKALGLAKKDSADSLRHAGMHSLIANSKSARRQIEKKGHKQGEREARSKSAGYYVHGHKNYGDVYEA